MAFFLFLLVNATLFIRPGEIIPAMLGWEVYFYAIVSCFIVALPDVMRYFTEKSLIAKPITLVVFGLLALTFISGVVAADMAEALRTTIFLAKIVIYYVLFVSLVTTSTRLRTLLLCILIFCCATTFVGILRYHDLIQLTTLKPLEDNLQLMHGEETTIQRLQGTGIFQDPNELCVVLAVIIPVALYFFMTDRSLFLRLLCMGMLPLFFYGIYLTHSRGGFLAFLGGLGSLFLTRYGWRKTVLLGTVGLPVLLILFGGRQTSLSGATTANTRIELWQDWLMTFRENVVLGKAMTLRKDEAPDEKRRSDIPLRLLAHNSYLQGFADLGFFGGCLFLGGFLTALWSIYRLNPKYCLQLNPDLKQLQPFVLASIVAYCLGMATLSICFIVPTYLILALGASYTQMAHRSCLRAPPLLRIDLRLLGVFAIAGVCFLISIFVFVRAFG